MATSTTRTNKPILPRGNDASPLKYNRAALYSGKALDFDGVNDYVDLDGFTLSGTTATISFYYKTDSNKALAYIFDNTQRWVIGQADTTDSFGFYDGSTWRKSTQTLTLGEWYHITAVIDGGNVEFLWNGQSVGDTFTGANPISWASLTTFKLGWSYSASGIGQINGQLSGFKIFNTALTAAQVSDLYNNPEKIVPTGVEDTALKLWLPMMEGAGTTAYDGSGNGNHGTISGATYVHGIGAPVTQSAVMDWNKGTNLLKYSEQLNESAYWGRNNVDVTEDDETAPDGQSTAELIKDTTTSAPHYINIGVTTAASTIYVQSVWVKKKDDGIYAGIRSNGVGGDSYIIFDFDTATIVATGSDIISNGVETYSNGWYRIYMTYTLQPTGAIYSVTNSSSSVIPSYAGTGKGYYIWGAQLEASDSLTAYIPNHTDAAITTPVLLPQGLTTGRDITGVNLFENVRKQGALNLDGNSWAEVHDNESLDFGTGSFTLEAWVKVKYTSGGSVYNAFLTLGGDIVASNNCGLAVDSALKPYLIYNTNASVGPIQNEGDWIHIVGNYDGTKTTLYVNGSQVDQDTISAGTITNTNAKMIGKGASSNRIYSDQIAQPRIYNRALTAEEVQRNYNAGKNIYK